jgi:hypothetical protein
MNSSGLLEPSYLSIGLGLNLSRQTTYLSSGARAWNAPLPDGVGTCAGESHGGDGVHALLRLMSSIMLRRLTGL